MIKDQTYRAELIMQLVEQATESGEIELTSKTSHTASVVLHGMLALMLIMMGCDSRNEADVPPQVYKLAGSYSSGSVIKHVTADGNYAAIAATVAGMQVLDVSNPASISSVYTFLSDENVGALWVALS